MLPNFLSLWLWEPTKTSFIGVFSFDIWSMKFRWYNCPEKRTKQKRVPTKCSKSHFISKMDWHQTDSLTPNLAICGDRGADEASQASSNPQTVECVSLFRHNNPDLQYFQSAWRMESDNHRNEGDACTGLINVFVPSSLVPYVIKTSNLYHNEKYAKVGKHPKLRSE